MLFYWQGSMRFKVTITRYHIMPPILKVQNLRKVYGKKNLFTAVDGISFEMEPGEILGLLGPNGSGKTTTIQMLLGTLSYTSGSIQYFGKEFLDHRTEILQHVSFASTYTNLPFMLSMEENLEVFGYLYGFSPKESIERYEPLLKRFGIYEKRKQRVSSLSAGQITRLMLVKAFFIKPKIILLDEPTASLDPDIASDICSFLLEQRDLHGTSILFTSHKMDEVMEICDRAIFLKQGKIIADDIPQNLAKRVSRYRVRLVIADGLKRTIAIAEKFHYPYFVDHRMIEVAMDEEQIAGFLHNLSQEAVSYANIKIEEPSLEDFFLQIAKK